MLEAGVQAGRRVLVVSNPDVASPYGDVCLNSLREAGFSVELLVIDAGEHQKTPATVAEIHDAAYSAKLERSSLMVALGGGVVGDMTGFAAATWLRGIQVVQVPTTLLAMVDASIGGKTGVNHPRGKNLIGAFHQPRLVLIDPSTLNTLPEREFRAGMAEVIKYGILGDTALFEELEACADPSTPAGLGAERLSSILQRSAAGQSTGGGQPMKRKVAYGRSSTTAIPSAMWWRPSAAMAPGSMVKRSPLAWWRWANLRCCGAAGVATTPSANAG